MDADIGLIIDDLEQEENSENVDPDEDEEAAEQVQFEKGTTTHGALATACPHPPKIMCGFFKWDIVLALGVLMLEIEKALNSFFRGDYIDATIEVVGCMAIIPLLFPMRSPWLRAPYLIYEVGSLGGELAGFYEGKCNLGEILLFLFGLFLCIVNGRNSAVLFAPHLIDLFVVLVKIVYC
uniref:Uncharacterized protein n=1 Tax=Globodera rostochiensis TaxID=31243 RepID=A0A914I9A4_GLORO